MHSHHYHVKRAFRAHAVAFALAASALACLGCSSRSSSNASSGASSGGEEASATGELGAGTRGQGLWFADIGAPLALSTQEASGLLRWVRAHWQSDSASQPSPASDERVSQLVEQLRSQVAPRLVEDRAVRIVFLSASDGLGPAHVTFAPGKGVLDALVRALLDLRARERVSFKEPPAWLALDVVAEVREPWRIGRGTQVNMTRGIHGLAFESDLGVAFLGSEIVGRRLVAKELTLRHKRLGTRAGAYARDSAHAQRLKTGFERRAILTARAFTTDTFFSDSRTDTVQAAVRAHPAERAVSDQRLRAAIAEGSAYLNRMTDPEGRYVYSYLPKQNSEKDKYNMVRHAGTAFSMVQAYELLRQPEILAAAERALVYMNRHIIAYGPKGADMAALAFSGKIKLGGVALAALALATHVRVTGRRDHLAQAQKLCRYMAHNQRKDGSFVHQRADPGGKELPFVSMYYPGEALLGLLSVYRLDRNPKWLDVAEKGARFLIQVRDAKVATTDLKHDHWLLYALELLHAERPDPMYLRHAMRIAEAIVTAQKKAGLPADQIGAYAMDEPRATPIATRNEGLMAAYRLAQENGKKAMAERILAAVELGNEVLVSMRIAPVRALYLERPDRALGGVTRSHDNFEVRIDYVQHSISAWLALLRARAQPAQK